MIKDINRRIAQAWLNHPVIDGLLGGVVFVVVSLVLINFVLPAWAVTIPVGHFVIELDSWAPWVGIAVTIMIWWEARRARTKATEAAAIAAVASKGIQEVAVQIDGLLADRDAAKIREGEAAEKRAGEETAATLARGQEQGRTRERESARLRDEAPAAAPSAAPAGVKSPLPVADDRTAAASERSAAALERTAAATETKAADSK